MRDRVCSSGHTQVGVLLDRVIKGVYQEREKRLKRCRYFHYIEISEIRDLTTVYSVRLVLRELKITMYGL